MSEIIIKKSKKFEALESGAFVSMFADKFGNEFLEEWSKESKKSNYWVIGKHKDTVKPVPDKLTERTTSLRNSLDIGQRANINDVKFSGNTLTVKFGSRMAYANRQQHRTPFLFWSLDKMLDKLNLIKKRALSEMGAFK